MTRAQEQAARQALGRWRAVQADGRADVDQGLLQTALQAFKTGCSEAEALQPLYGLIAINNVAVARGLTGERGRAKELLESALMKAISETEWVETRAALLNNLGVIYHRQGQLGPARRYYQEALQILAEHSTCLEISTGTLCNLADLNLQQGKPGPAESLLKRARQVIDRHIGQSESVPPVVNELECRVQVGLGWVGVGLERLARAESCFLLGLRKGSRDTVRARVLEARSQLGLADVYSRQALHATKAAGDNIARGLEARQEKLEQAELFFTEALHLLTELGDLGRHPYFDGAAIYIDHLLRFNRFEQAEQWVHGAVPWLETMYGEEHPTVLAYLERMVLVLKGSQRDPEASTLEQSLARMRNSLRAKESAYFKQD